MIEDPANQTAADRDVFVSCASQDAALANSIVENLQQHALKCWMAPRDVKPGAQYADAIVRAINEAKAVVLVMSGSAVGSPHVGKEIERGLPIANQSSHFVVDPTVVSPGPFGEVTSG